MYQNRINTVRKINSRDASSQIQIKWFGRVKEAAFFTRKLGRPDEDVNFRSYWTSPVERKGRPCPLQKVILLLPPLFSLP